MKIPYFIPWITRDDKKNVMQALNQRWLTDGSILKKFENKVSKFIGAKYSIGVGNATQALHLTLRSLEVKDGDEVIVPTFTFAATANVVKYCGAKPILTDVDYDTYNILPLEIKKNITKKTRGIIVVHYGGQACDMTEIKSIANKNNLFIVEDCAHAFGSKYMNTNCGNIGQAGCFSFYPTKIITTGEGGMVTCNNKKLLIKIKLLRSQGINKTARQRELDNSWKYDIVDLGYNYRLDEIRSSLGLSQLQRVNEINKMRIKIAEIYDKEIRKIKGLQIPFHKEDRNHIYHLYTIKINKEFHLTRDQLFEKLAKKGIKTSVQYYPLHLMSYYFDKKSKSKFPNASKLKNEVLCLPIFPKMTTSQVQKIVTELKNIN